MRKDSNQDKLARRFDTNHNTNDSSNEDYQKLIDFISSFSVMNFGSCPIQHVTSQAEKKITVITSSATDKMTFSFTQNDNFYHFE